MSNLRHSLLPAIAIFWLALTIRTTNLYSLPLYHDEGDHLRWAQFYELGQPNYPIFMDGKFLLGASLAQFQVYGPEAIWVARAAVAIFSTLACAAGIGIGARLGGQPLGWLTGVIYAILPLAAFYERQIVADSLMATFGACAVLFTLRLVSTQQKRWLLALSTALALSFLSKFFGILFLAYPFTAVLFSVRSRRPFGQNNWFMGLAVAGAALIVAGFLFWQQPLLGYNNNLLIEQKVGHVTCPPLLCEGNLSKQIAYFTNGLRSLNEITSAYFGWPIVVLALLSWLLAPKGKRHVVGTLVTATTLMLVAFSSAAYSLPARYLVFLGLPVACLGSAGGYWLVKRLSGSALQLGASLGLAVITFWPMANTINLITRPEQANLTYDDRVNYIVGPISGTGMLQAARDIMARESHSSMSPVLIFAYGFKEQLNQVLVHFDARTVRAYVSNDVKISDVGHWLATQTPIYIFDAIKSDPNIVPGNPGLYEGLLAQETARYIHLGGEEWLRVQKVVGHDANLQKELLAEFFIRPNEIPSTFESLAKSLPTDRDLALVLYPPSQMAELAPRLSQHANVALYPIGNTWPLDVPAAEAELATIAAQHATIQVAFMGETIGDPNRELETWLNTHLYRLGETWFEPVRVIEFVGGENGQDQPIASDILFNDGLTLRSVYNLDPAVTPDGLLRLQLNWQTASPTNTQYKIFVHIFAGDKIIAQHDGQALGELRPTNTWQVGETIRDQFAIRLPRDAATGEYQIRIGLYDLATQQRLHLASGEEFWVGGKVTVK